MFSEQLSVQLCIAGLWPVYFYLYWHSCWARPPPCPVRLHWCWGGTQGAMDNIAVLAIWPIQSHSHSQVCCGPCLDHNFHLSKI